MLLLTIWTFHTYRHFPIQYILYGHFIPMDIIPYWHFYLWTICRFTIFFKFYMKNAGGEDFNQFIKDICFNVCGWIRSYLPPKKNWLAVHSKCCHLFLISIISGRLDSFLAGLSRNQVYGTCCYAIMAHITSLH